jgi:hypothetical protein
MLFQNGDKYEGSWQSNNFHGMGRLTKSNGIIYESDFLNGQKHGKGVI